MKNFVLSYQDKYGDWSEEIIEAVSIEAAEKWADEYCYQNRCIDWDVDIQLEDDERVGIKQ